MKTSEQIREELIERAISWGDAFSKGDSRNANSQNRKIGQVLERFRQDKVACETLLTPLFAHSSPSVRLMACVWALEFGIHTREAESILAAIEQDPTTRLVGLMAHINLSKWNEKKHTHQDKG